MIRATPSSSAVFAVCALVMAMGTMARPASATNLVGDWFTYPNGNLVQPGGANGGWYSHTGSGIGPIPVSGRTIQLHVAPLYGEDVSRKIPLRGPTAQTYASFTLRVWPGSVITETYNGVNQPQYLALFRSGLEAESTLVYRMRTALLTARFGGGYTIGIDATTYNMTTQPFTPWTSDLNFSQTYRIVTRYDGSTGTSTLWVDPVDESSPSVESLAPLAANTQVGFYSLRQGTPTDGTNATVTIDNVGVGTTFAEAIVSDSISTVPSISQWGMLVLGLIMLAGGGCFIARSRSTAVA